MRLRAVGEVRVVEEEPRLRLERVAIEVVDPAGVERAGAADQPVDLVALLQEELGEVRAVLAGDPGDQGLLAVGVPDASCGDRQARRHARGRRRSDRRGRPRAPGTSGQTCAFRVCGAGGGRAPAASAGSARRPCERGQQTLGLARPGRRGPHPSARPRPPSLLRAGPPRRSAGRRRSTTSACSAGSCRSGSDAPTAAAHPRRPRGSRETVRLNAKEAHVWSVAAAARIVAAWLPPPDRTNRTGVAMALRPAARPRRPVRDLA